MCNLCSEPSATVGRHYLRRGAVIGARWGLPAGRTWRVWRSPPTHGTLYPVSVYIFSLYLCICVKRLMCWGVGEWTSGGDTWRAGRFGYTRCSPPSPRQTSLIFESLWGKRVAIHFINDSLWAVFESLIYDPENGCSFWPLTWACGTKDK